MKRHYYIATFTPEQDSLSIYYFGKFTKKKMEEEAIGLNDKYPMPFVIFKGWGVTEIAHNSVTIDTSGLSDRIDQAIKTPQDEGHVVPGGEMVN